MPVESSSSSGDGSRLPLEPRKLGKNVYVLGSGFSAAMGMPTIARFIPDGLALLKRALGESFAAAGEMENAQLLREMLVLIHEYRPIVASVARGEPTIQDYFCAVESAADEIRRKILILFFVRVWSLAWKRHADELAQMENLQSGVRAKCVPGHVPVVPRHLTWAHLAKGAVDVISLHPDGQPLACAYEAFLAQLFIEAQAGLQPAVISLNYDLLLEEKLRKRQDTVGRTGIWDCDFDYDLNGNPASQGASPLVPYLKLHGSFDWRRKSSGTIDRRAASSDSVVLPGWVRIAGKSWLPAKALEHLKTAQRIFIIGYSMAPIDLDVRYLLCQATATPEPPEIYVYSKMAPDEATRATAEFFGARVILGSTSPDYDLLAFLRDHKPPTDDTGT